MTPLRGPLAPEGDRVLGGLIVADPERLAQMATRRNLRRPLRSGVGGCRGDTAARPERLASVVGSRPATSPEGVVLVHPGLRGAPFACTRRPGSNTPKGIGSTHPDGPFPTLRRAPGPFTPKPIRHTPRGAT